MGLYAIKVPDVGEGVAEAELVEWHVNVGDLVKKGLITPEEALTRSLDKTAMTTLLNRKTA